MTIEVERYHCPFERSCLATFCLPSETLTQRGAIVYEQVVGGSRRFRCDVIRAAQLHGRCGPGECVMYAVLPP